MGYNGEMTAIEKRLDAIIELLVLLVNQTEARQNYTQSLRCQLLESHEDFQDYSKIFQSPKERLAAVAQAVEAVRQDSTERQEPQ